MIPLINILEMKGIYLNNYKYKIHLATGKNPSPLEAYLEGTFKGWQEDQKNKNFPCDMVVGLVHLGGDRWLFCGVYKILDVHKRKNKRFQYITEILPGQDDIIGRIVIKHKREFRAAYVWGPTLIKNLEVGEILESPLSIEKFPGYNNMLISHNKLNLIVSKQEASWKSALSNVNGVYLITDITNGKKYVGSALGEEGIWGRLCSYINNGHGGNIDLKKLLIEKGNEHVNNFQYAVLEIADKQATLEQIMKRENYWKEVLKSREFGYN